jgi:hypothetical protein
MLTYLGTHRDACAADKLEVTENIREMALSIIINLHLLVIVCGS